jgi:hypothetical protein
MSSADGAEGVGDVVIMRVNRLLIVSTSAASLRESVSGDSFIEAAEIWLGRLSFASRKGLEKLKGQRRKRL